MLSCQALDESISPCGLTRLIGSQNLTPQRATLPMKSLPLLIVPWMITFIICMWCASVTYSVVSSNRPTPTPTKAANHDQTKASGENSERRPNQNSAEALVSSIDKLVVAIDQKRESDERGYRENAPPSQWWTILPTVVVAVFAIASTVVALLQWRTYKRQAELMENSLGETRKSADAAILAAKTADTALKMAENPDVQLVKVTFTVKDSSAGVRFVFTFRNFGRSFAHDVRGFYAIGEAKTNPSNLISMQPEYAGISPGMECTFYGTDNDEIITASFLADVLKGNEPLFLNVPVVYKDSFGARKGSHSGAVFMPNQHEFVIIPRGIDTV